MYGLIVEIPQRETTPFYPRSHGQALRLLDDHQIGEAYGMFAANGILFNHEGPLRGETFVTRKITGAVAAISSRHHR